MGNEEAFYSFIRHLASVINVNEADTDGKNCAAIIYSNLILNPDSYDDQELRFLKSIGSDLDVRCLDDPSVGRSMVLDAAYKGRPGIFKTLLEIGASTEVRCMRGRTLSDYIKMDFKGKSEMDKK